MRERTPARQRVTMLRTRFRLPAVLLGLSPCLKALAASAGTIAEFWEVVPRTRAAMPLMGGRVVCDFPSPADDYLEGALDFNELVGAHLASMFAVRCAGDSMTGAGIFAGDIVVVHKGMTARDREIILGLVGNEFTIKRYRCKGGRCWLQAENPAYPDIHINEHSGFEVWGIVKHTVRSF